MEPIVTKKQVDALSYKIIGAAIEVHRHLGPGLLESNYQQALIHELQLCGLRVTAQKKVTVPYKAIFLECDLRYDLLVEDLIIVELKAVLEIHPVFEATLLSYMKHLRRPKGILINFHVKNIAKYGQKTLVNEYYQQLPDQ